MSLWFLAERPAMIRWILILSIGVLPGILINPRRIVEVFAPFTSDSLEVPTAVELGTIKPMEKRTVKVNLRNRTGHLLSLRPVETDCGCLVVNDAPTAILGNQSASLSVAIMGPASPGQFSRSLVIQPQADGGPVWRISLRGQVAADVWSEPAQLDLAVAPSSVAEGDLWIHHVSEFKLGRVTPQADTVQIIDSQELDDGRRLRIRIEASGVTEVGKTVLDVFSGDGAAAPALSIPIHWRPQAVIGYVPQRIDLRQFDREAAENENLCRIVAVVVPRERRADEVEVKTLVPWVHVAKQDCVGSVLRLEVDFARDEMPAEFQQAILSARLVDQPAGDELVAAGYRSPSR